MEGEKEGEKKDLGLEIDEMMEEEEAGIGQRGGRRRRCHRPESLGRVSSIQIGWLSRRQLPAAMVSASSQAEETVEAGHPREPMGGTDMDTGRKGEMGEIATTGRDGMTIEDETEETSTIDEIADEYIVT